MQGQSGPRPTDSLTTTIVAAGAVVLLVAVCAGVMYLITSFLFAFSGGQYRMVPVVGYGALAVIGATLLIAIVVWRPRSLAAAGKKGAIAHPLGGAPAKVGEWVPSIRHGAARPPPHPAPGRERPPV